MLRLPRFGCSISGWNEPAAAPPVPRRRPRWASPVTACSILMTSAPQSASTAPAAGVKVNWATSTILTPFMGWYVTATPLCRNGRGPYGERQRGCHRLGWSERVQPPGVVAVDESSLLVGEALGGFLELVHDAGDLGVGVRVVAGPDDAVGADVLAVGGVGEGLFVGVEADVAL